MDEEEEGEERDVHNLGTTPSLDNVAIVEENEKPLNGAETIENVNISRSESERAEIEENMFEEISLFKEHPILKVDEGIQVDFKNCDCGVSNFQGDMVND